MPCFGCIVEHFAFVFILIVLAFNSKHFAIVIAFSISLISGAVFERSGKNFLSLFNLSLPKMRVTSTGPFSLDTQENIFVLVLFSVISVADGQFLFNMHVKFIGNCLACLTSSKRVCLKLHFIV